MTNFVFHTESLTDVVRKVYGQTLATPCPVYELPLIDNRFQLIDALPEEGQPEPPTPIKKLCTTDENPEAELVIELERQGDLSLYNVTADVFNGPRPPAK